MRNLPIINLDRAIISEVQHFWIISELYHHYLRVVIDVVAQGVM